MIHNRILRVALGAVISTVNCNSAFVCIITLFILSYFVQINDGDITQ